MHMHVHVHMCMRMRMRMYIYREDDSVASDALSAPRFTNSTQHTKYYILLTTHHVLRATCYVLHTTNYELCTTYCFTEAHQDTEA